MNLLLAILFLIVLSAGCVALIPVLTLGAALLLAGAVFFIWLLPVLIIAASDKTTGAEKLAWILAIFFLSWFAWIFYFLLAPLKPRERYYY